jgi:integrase
MARAMFRWALKRGYVRENPFEGVQPVGRPAAGKKQLRFEEAERFISAGFRLFDERGDAMALAAVTALLLGCRASEVTHLRARDLDCGGTRLWIAAHDGDYRGKTRNATRNSDVPEVLRPRLLKRVEDLRPDDYLFGATAAGKPRCRQLLYSAVHRVCAAAEVPRVCAHSLRGLWATAGVRSGALSHAVAAALGHGSFAMTARHYVRPGTIDGARTDGLMQFLDLKEGKPATDPARLSAEELLAALPTETLTRLLDLVRHSHSPRDPCPT